MPGEADMEAEAPTVVEGVDEIRSRPSVGDERGGMDEEAVRAGPSSTSNAREGSLELKPQLSMTGEAMSARTSPLVLCVWLAAPCVALLVWWCMPRNLPPLMRKRSSRWDPPPGRSPPPPTRHASARHLG